MKRTTLLRLLLALSCSICFAATCEDAVDLDSKSDDNGDDTTGNGNNTTEQESFDPNDPGGCNQEEPDYGTCTETEISDYVDCVESTCGDQYRTCLGENYMQGDFTGGKCQNMMECSVGCKCDDTTCQQQCGTKILEGGCMGCMTNMGNCAIPCIPSCMGIPGT